MGCVCAKSNENKTDIDTSPILAQKQEIKEQEKHIEETSQLPSVSEKKKKKKKKKDDSEGKYNLTQKIFQNNFSKQLTRFELNLKPGLIR